MKHYTLKSEFKGLSIAKNIFPIGLVTLDTNTVKKEDYEKYSKLGFQDIFEIIDNETCKCIENNWSDCVCHVDKTSIKCFTDETTDEVIPETNPPVIIKKYTNEANDKPRRKPKK